MVFDMWEVFVCIYMGGKYFLKCIYVFVLLLVFILCIALLRCCRDLCEKVFVVRILGLVREMDTNN